MRAAGARVGRRCRRPRGRDRDHQPAGDDDPLGEGDGKAGRAGDRLAEPRVGADLHAAEGRGRRARGAAADGPPARPLLLRDEDRAPAGDDSRSARAVRAGRGALRHRRLVSDLAAHRRPRARHRRHQRQPHAALRHRHACLERRPLPHLRRAAVHAARGPAVERFVRGDRAGTPRRGRADPGLRRRPAGRSLRAGGRAARRRKEHLRHGGVSDVLDRRPAGGERQRLVDDTRMRVTARAALLPGGIGVHRGSARGLAPRRPRPDREGRRRGAARCERGRQRRRDDRAGAHWTWRTLLGSRGAGPDHRPVAGHEPWPRCPGGARGHRAVGGRCGGVHAAGFGCRAPPSAGGRRCQRQRPPHADPGRCARARGGASGGGGDDGARRGTVGGPGSRILRRRDGRGRCPPRGAAV